jgi:hypothetical protein
MSFSQKSEPVKSRGIWQNNLVSSREFAMKNSRFIEEQIAFVLKQAEAGKTVAEVCLIMVITWPNLTLDRMAPGDYAKKNLKMSEISNFPGTAFG